MGYEYSDGFANFRVRGGIVADSGEGYKNLKDCLDEIDRVKDTKTSPVKKEG